ncbi:hypothetical protein ACHWQZ_G003851 [Mnemiopsis leidyi]
MTNTTLLTLATDYGVGTAEMAAVAFGLVLNTMTIPYFYHHRKQFTSLLYLLISITDILVLVSCFPNAVSLLHRKAIMLFRSKVVCVLSGFIFNIASRMSVFLIAMLSVARAVQLMFPFTHIKSSIIVGLSFAYLLLNVFLAGLPLVFSKNTYYYVELFAQCSWGLNELSFVNSTNSTLWYGMTYSTIILPWLVPGLVVVLSCIASVSVLLKSNILRRRLRKNSKSIRKHFEVRNKWSSSCTTETATVKSQHGSPTHLKNGRRESGGSATTSTSKATVTIVIVTALYVIFNMPCWLVYCYLLSTGFDSQTWTKNLSFKMDQLQLMFILVGRVSVALNSAANPVVYLCRMDLLREMLWSCRVWVLVRRLFRRRERYVTTNSTTIKIENVTMEK